ncbi:hypothetical protein TYRP_001449 [Tyrophagus putrescentiae]|nr:hypothetical protein TYRP_001449 [Tyrophagus putrescentiae]
MKLRGGVGARPSGSIDSGRPQMLSSLKVDTRPQLCLVGVAAVPGEDVERGEAVAGNKQQALRVARHVVPPRVKGERGRKFRVNPVEGGKDGNSNVQ